MKLNNIFLKGSNKGFDFRCCILMIIFSVSIAATSCTKLNEPLYSQLSNSNFLQTDAEIVAAVGAAYSGLRDFQSFGNMWTIYCTSDEVAIVGRTGGDWAGDGQDQQMTDHKWTVNNRFFKGSWEAFFSQVNNCNRIIYQLEGLDPEKYATYISEVKTIRAL